MQVVECEIYDQLPKAVARAMPEPTATCSGQCKQESLEQHCDKESRTFDRTINLRGSGMGCSRAGAPPLTAQLPGTEHCSLYPKVPQDKAGMPFPRAQTYRVIDAGACLLAVLADALGVVTQHGARVLGGGGCVALFDLLLLSQQQLQRAPVVQLRLCRLWSFADATVLAL